ncbi:hypothetical protein BJY16_008422 [Actinoplanes octamycinicus]|uniref:Uncharacterized protein n=1 Tax=Actinoplanes octamycinicus TaxID=135948 RepID=A0A7W7MCB8_9ACTN|nr:hypothetical protein [Actinoplanes octamycinicus]MBB4744963.1 hypothetical protein [Actinoplanes octamycinicus]
MLLCALSFVAGTGATQLVEGALTRLGAAVRRHPRPAASRTPILPRLGEKTAVTVSTPKPGARLRLGVRGVSSPSRHP